MAVSWPRVALCFLTYQRTEYALASIHSICDNLIYGSLGWYVADDGSSHLHYSSVMDAIAERGVILFGSHHEKMGAGASWNRAIDEALKVADIILWIEDDWTLDIKLDIHPYVKLLLERQDIGMVRLGYLAVGLKCEVMGYDGIHYLKMSRETQYAYSGNPNLRHRRYFDTYPRYPTDKNPGECEVWHDYDFREGKPSGPDIWWPANLPNCGWGGGWRHIGTVQSY